MTHKIAGATSALRDLFTVIVVVCCAAAAQAQAGRGGISGLVADPSGAVIAGASVTLEDIATGVKQSTVTSSGGLYSFMSLAPGTYKITATEKGFQTMVQDHVRVTVDQTTLLNLTLNMGNVSQVVTVNATSDVLDTSNSTVGQLIDSAAIDRVPLLYRNVFDLAQLSAGVNSANASPNSSDSMLSIQNISSGRPGIDISSATINGAIVGSVYYMIDGSPIGIAENNAAAIMPAMNIPEDGVDEVRVETQNTPASFQSGAAGVISLVTKSGTDKFHGDVFGVFRPEVLSANEYFNKQTQLSSGMANTPPDFYRYQEGAAIGGPIKKQKLFFFGDYEATQQEEYEGIDYFSVPTMAERSGNFSAMSFTIYDPTQPDFANGPLAGTRQPFTNNTITNPNPIGMLYLSKMPECNLPSTTSCEAATTDVVNNYGIPGMDPYSAQRFDVRVDWIKSEKQRIFTRFSFDRLAFATANVFPSGWDPNYADNTTNGRNILVADDLTLSPSTFLQLRYSFTRHYENQGGPSAYSSNDITQQGFPSSLASQVLYKQLPFMLFNDVGGGVGGTADSNIFQYASEDSDANAAVTKVWGKHQISTGAEWMKRFLNVGQPYAPAGSYAFDVSATDQTVSSVNGGSDFASILVGQGTEPGSESYDFTEDIFAAETSPYYAAFIEDTYHATKNLTITAGLRWDIFGGRNERYNRQEYFDPTAANTFDSVAYTGAEIFANGSNRSPFTTNLDDLGPRLAFAWQPVTHLVLRGGAGIYYGPSTQMVASALNNADGYSSVTNWNSTCYNADGNTIFYSSTCATPATDNFTGAYSLSNPFPAGVVPVFTISSPPRGLANNLGTALQTVLHSQRTPTVYNFNFAVEYELPHQVVVTAGYVGSRGLFLPFGAVDLNQLDLATIQKYNYSMCVDTSQSSCVYVPNQWAAIQPATNANYGAATVPLWTALQPFPQFGDGSYGAGNGVNVNGYPAGDSEYSSLQAKVQKRLTSHFTTLSTFTWGKLMTDDGNPPLSFVANHNGSVQDWRNLSYEHSISPQDVKYQFSGEVSYDLPIGKGRRVDLKGFGNAALGGWTMNAIVYLSTGNPINSPSSGTTPSYFNQRADMTCNPAAHAPHTVAAWFNDNCFAIPGTENAGTVNPFVPGTAPDYLDNVRTKGARDLDLSTYKAFNFGETKELRFDASAYNLTNTPQFGYPSVPSIVGAVDQGLPFGQITGTNNTPRQFQFGARFTF
ncbi:MAG TPA: carboxypeptidase-like regulatory domain-containing protein [Terracidiphilus sp.]|nr:carboxypeptidase-like regulatory domain-containing protein [Terracidiphilus sp.]